jgi:uncharacterized protein (TIGR00159 family)
MLDSLLGYLTSRNEGELLRDALDVLVTYYLFYRALLVLRGTRAIQVGVGLGVVVALYVVAQALQLMTVLNVMGALLFNALLIVVVVFQNDIRRGLMRVGSGAWLGPGRSLESRVLDQVVDAASELARHRIGAIIAFEQEANLDEFVGANKGHRIDAIVTSELLVSLFLPEATNKLHDGAVIIKDLRIATAGVFFPMPASRVMDASFGSRHRAALGITEETDAVVVVVSEERGTISFCFNGNIVANLDGPRLRAALDGVFALKAPPKKRKKTKSPSRRNIPLVQLGDDEPGSEDRPSLHIITTPAEEQVPPSERTPQPLRKSKTDITAKPATVGTGPNPTPVAPTPLAQAPRSTGGDRLSGEIVPESSNDDSGDA